MLTGLGRGVVRMPVLRAPEIAWPPICRSGIFETGPRWFLEFALGEKPNCETQAGPAILDLPLETLVAWCQAHPDSAPAFVAATVPFLETDGEGAPTSSLHTVMTRLLDEFGHCPGVPAAVSRNIGSFSWMGTATSVWQLYREPLAALQDHAKREVATGQELSFVTSKIGFRRPSRWTLNGRQRPRPKAFRPQFPTMIVLCHMRG